MQQLYPPDTAFADCFTDLLFNISVLVLPKSVNITAADSYTNILPSYMYNVTCVVAQAYPDCPVVWTVPRDLDRLAATDSANSGTAVVTRTAELSLNVSRDDNGKTVTCTAVCTDMGINTTVSHEIQVPCKYLISLIIGQRLVV